jgi:Leucine-rich repeat (LRR) protein
VTVTRPRSLRRPRRWAAASAIAVVAALIVPAVPAAADPSAVTFGDSVVRAAVNVGLGRDAADGSPVATADLARLRTLTTPSGASGTATSLDGLQYATSLTRLSLTWSAAGASALDLTPISGLTSLTSLTLVRGGIEELAPLSGLRNLNSLTLNENAIADLTPLGGLVRLQNLALTDNRIVQTEPLAPLTALTQLALGWNPVESISGLRNMTSLSTFTVAFGKISDLSPLANATALTVLRLSGNEVVDLTPVAGLTRLTLLWVDDNDVADISPVASLTAMASLGIGGNDISDLSPLAGLTALREFNVENNRVADISPVPMEALTTFKFANNRIEDISSLSALAENRVLADFDLSGNRIADLRPLAAVPATGALRSVALGGQRLASTGDTYVPAGADTYRRPVVLPSIEMPNGEPVLVDAADAAGTLEWTAIAGATELPYAVSSAVTVGGVPATYTATSSYAVTSAEIVTELDAATTGIAYRAALSVTQGVGPVAYESSDLPSWLSVSARGELTGTPTEAGRVAFTLRAVDQHGNVISKRVSLTVTDAALTTSPGKSGTGAATGLANTGLDVTALILGAALALLAGAGTILFARRRATA